MRRYITLLLFIGLAWGQEYDPETGEVVKKQYVPETGELIKNQNDPETENVVKKQYVPETKNQNDSDEGEIWNKKIPPSLYLEELSKEKEQRSRFGSYALGYLSLGSGILILTLTDEWGMGTIFIAGGLFVASRPFRNSPMTDAGKQFEKVKNIQDNNEIERLAYESLVSLASTSRIKKNEKDSKQRRNRFRNSRNSSPKEDLVFILLTALVSTAIEENKKNKPEQNIQIQLTIEEKALDNFLNQIPIGITSLTETTRSWKPYP
jgi:hypothetical protein